MTGRRAAAAAALARDLKPGAILARLRAGPCAVGELVTDIGMEQPAVSHQLRILRDLGMVRGKRSGRNTIYRLFDPHVGGLLDEAWRHAERLRTDRT